MIIATVVGLWLAFGVLSYGIFLHEHKRDFNYFAAFPFALLVLFTRIASLFAILMLHGGSWGFELIPYTRDERYENFCKMYGTEFKTRSEFDKEY